MSKMIRTWSDVKDIIIAVHETLNELSKREDLIGWIPGNQAVTGAVAEQLASLAKENSDLRKRLSEVSEPTFQGLTFDQLCEVLRREEIDLASVDQESAKAMSACAEKLGDSKPSLLHLFWLSRKPLLFGARSMNGEILTAFHKLNEFGLVSCEQIRAPAGFGVIGTKYYINDEGSRFLLRLTRDIGPSDLKLATDTIGVVR
jgi:hypothetical protein